MFSEEWLSFNNLTEIAGIAGFGLYVCNYIMLTFRVLTDNHVIYYLINVTAASLVLTGLLNSFDLASALIQIFWICISTVGIFIRIRPGARKPGLVLPPRQAGASAAKPYRLQGADRAVVRAGRKFPRIRRSVP